MKFCYSSVYTNDLAVKARTIVLAGHITVYIIYHITLDKKNQLVQWIIKKIKTSNDPVDFLPITCYC
jgi:hypothetical protein